MRDVRGRAHHEDEAHERSLDHDLSAVAIRKAPPEWREQRGESRRDAQTQTGPHRNVADIGDAELLEIEREKRNNQCETGESDEARGGDREQVSSPVQANGL